MNRSDPQPKTPLFPSEFATGCLMVDTGKPPDFRDRKYLLPILDMDHRRLVVMSSRQSGKSTLLMIKLIYEAVLIPNNRIVFVAPEDQHIQSFRRDRVLPQFEEDSRLIKYGVTGKMINNRHQLILANRSRIFLRSIAHNPASVRGISGYTLFIDEEQNIPRSSVTVALETLSAYPDRAKIWHCGTAGSLLNSFSERYQNSSRNEWIITCNQCGKENAPLGLDHLDPKRPYLFCTFCGKEMAPANGRWVSQNPDRTYTGFRICRLMEPTARWHTQAKTGILDVLSVYSEDQFKREVLAIPSGSNQAAFRWEEVIDCCRDYDLADPAIPHPEFESALIAGTVDWAYNHESDGKAYTVLAIWKLESNQELSLLFAKRQIGLKYDNWKVGLEEILTTFHRFCVKIIAMDWMIGDVQSQEIRRIFGNQYAYRFLYAGQGDKLTWDQHKKLYHVNRTESLDQLNLWIQRKKIHFPRLNACHHLLVDFNNVGVVYNPENDRKKYTKEGTDDFVHCTNYALLLAVIIKEDTYRALING